MSQGQLTLPGSGGSYDVILNGVKLGTVDRTTSHRARRVQGVGGVTRWVGSLADGTVVTKSNTYTRREAVDQVIAFAETD